jgi:hypothetical protein
VTVTVCVPVWNAASFVAETLESVRRQTHTDLRVLISVDDSDDDSVALCRAFERDPRFNVAVQPERLGWVGNTNWLLRRVDTPFGCILPHDDLIASDYLERVLAHLDRHPSAVLAYGDVAKFGITEMTVVNSEVTGDRRNRLVTFLQHHIDAAAFPGVFRRRVLDRGHVIPLDVDWSDSHWLGPAAMWLLALASEGDLVRVPDVLYRKRTFSDTERRQRDRSPESMVARWVDHCVECYHFALCAGDWAVPERQMIAAAALDRALSICGRSAAQRLWGTEAHALIAVASQYSLRVAGQIPARTPLLDDHQLPPPLLAIWEQARKRMEREVTVRAQQEATRQARRKVNRKANREANSQARREAKKQAPRNASGSAAVDSSALAAEGTA